MDRLFRLRERGTKVSTEIMAGVTTFLTMAYIVIVNPGILSQTGMDVHGVFIATVLASIAATLIMGLFANYPIVLAPGQGPRRASRLLPVRGAVLRADRLLQPLSGSAAARVFSRGQGGIGGRAVETVRELVRRLPVRGAAGRGRPAIGVGRAQVKRRKGSNHGEAKILRRLGRPQAGRVYELGRVPGADQ